MPAHIVMVVAPPSAVLRALSTILEGIRVEGPSLAPVLRARSRWCGLFCRNRVRPLRRPSVVLTPFCGGILTPVPLMLHRRIDDRRAISRASLREAAEIFHEHLRRVGLKHTAQRDTILRVFLAAREHLSIEQLHRRVRQNDAAIGVTTVYRTLKLLVECGLASEVDFPDGIARFEHRHNRRRHHHMICTGCGASVEFFSPEIDRLEQRIGRKYDYLPTHHAFQIYGLCPNCRRRRA